MYYIERYEYNLIHNFRGVLFIDLLYFDDVEFLRGKIKTVCEREEL